MTKLQSLLAEIRARAERPTRHMKDDVLLLLQMLEKCIGQRDSIMRITYKRGAFKLSNPNQSLEGLINSLNEELEEMAKGKGE